MMDRRAFNQELDGYIAQRKTGKRGQGILSLFEKTPARQGTGRPGSARLRDAAAEASKEDIHQKQEKELETMEAKLDEVNEIEDAVEEKREGLLAGFFKKLRGWNREDAREEPDEEAAAQEAPAADSEELRRVLKLTYGWLNYLPEEKVLAFKNSADFDLYKKVLTQHGLIKQKQTEQEAAPESSAKETDSADEEDA